MVVARSLRGMNDLFEPDLRGFHKVEQSITQICRMFGYHEIRTPILEDIALFKRGIGETTDIVEKEMFLVEDGDNTYCLRPENTAAVVRALIERGGVGEDTQEKLYYVGPMFRKERPQKGRLRQFHQFGVELFGVSEPSADVEIIVLFDQLFKTLGLSQVSLKINSLGTHDERNSYKTTLQEFFQKQEQLLCSDCKRRIVTNPLRVLDCKNPNCKELTMNAPNIIDSLGDASRKHFDCVQQGLLQQSVSFEILPTLVRGLDYYNRTVFEFLADDGLGAQNAVAAGGRYDGLFVTLGNKIDLPAIGAASGLERIIMLLGEKALENTSAIDLTLVYADDDGMKLAEDFAYKLRKVGVAADFSLSKKSTKAQMRRADRLGAHMVAVVGAQEITSKRVSIKNLKTGNSQELPLDISSIKSLFETNGK